MIENEIHLEEADRQRLGGLLRTLAEELFPKGDAGLFRANVLRAWRPSFLGADSFLFQAEVDAGEKKYSLCFLSAGNEAAVFSLYGSDYHETFAAATDSTGNTVFVLNEETALSYLRCCLTGRILPAVMVESPDELVTYDPGMSGGLQGGRKAVFYTPLEKMEKEPIARALEQNPLRIVERNESFLVLEACVLDGDTLGTRRYRVYTADQHPSLGMMNPKRRGQIERAEGGAALVSGLPDNYTVSEFASPGYYFTVDEEGENDKASVGDAERDLILRDVSRNLSPLIGKTSRFSRNYLRFFRMDHLDVEAEVNGRTERLSLLWMPGTVIALDGTSAPMHDVKDALRIATGRGILVENAVDAAEYTRFFCDNVWGDDGPFTVIGSIEDLKSVCPDPDKMSFGELAPSWDELCSKISPMSAAEIADGTADGYEVRGVICYGGGIFQTVLTVSPEGLVEMKDDDPLAGIEEWKCPDSPYGKFKHLKKTHLFEPVSAASLTGETIENRLIVGRLLLRESGIKVFRGCRFRGEADFRDFSTDGGMLIEDCVFEGGLSASGSRFGRALEIRSSTMIPLRGEAKGDLVDMERITCGDLLVSDCSVRGSLDLPGVTAARLQFSDLSLLGSMTFRFSVIEQYVSMSGLICGGDLDFYGAVVTHNYLSLDGPFLLAGNFDAGFLRVGTGVFIDSDTGENSEIKGNTSFQGAIIPSCLRLHNVGVRGEINGRYLNAGTVRIFGPEVSLGKITEDADDAKASAGPVRIGGGIDFSFAKIENSALFIDIEVTEEGSSPDSPSLSLCSAVIGHDLCLFATGGDGRSEGFYIENGSNCTAILPRGIDLSQARIGGEADLSCVRCPAGAIVLDDAEIVHDLIITPVEGETAKALLLEMNSFTCRGSVIITGLELIRDGSDPDARCGVSARFSRFEKGFVSAELGGESGQRIAVIPGFLDLTGSEINELSVSNRSFSAAPADKGKKKGAAGGQSIGIILNRAKVDKLTSVISERKYPRPIDLRYAEVKWWSFLSAAGSRSGTAGDFIELLNGDPHLQRHTFRSIERNLIEQGNEETADAIHKQMRKWIRRQLLRPRKNGRVSPGRRIRSFSLWLWDSATGSATTPFRLLMAVLLWFCLSTVFFSFPENITPSTEAITAYKGTLSPSQHPEAESWKGMAPFWVSIRHHIPVATFSAQSDWQPAGQDGLVVWKRSSAGEARPVRIGWLSAEDYANIVTGLHWVLWPVILVLASRKFFRHLEK